ncbi:MAG: hypothetical protein QM680_02790 [Luteolibacter sp.]
MIATDIGGFYGGMAMSNLINSQSASKGRRYTQAEKKQVIEFVETYNSEHGRGGQSAAASKFKISQLTIAGWLKSWGAPLTSKRNGGKLQGTQKTTFNAKLNSLLTLSQEIEQTEKELIKLKAKFKALKSSL